MGQLLTHVVCKGFGDDSIDEADDLRNRLAGECVNALFWRTTERLENTRHIMALPDGLEPVADAHGRFWIDIGALNRAERVPMPTGVPNTPPQANAEPEPWFMTADVDAPGFNFTTLVEHGFKMPKRVSERRWELWDGTVVAGKTKAYEAHSAGVRARIAELRTEYTTPAAGTVTDN